MLNALNIIVPSLEVLGTYEHLKKHISQKFGVLYKDNKGF